MEMHIGLAIVLSTLAGAALVLVRAANGALASYTSDLASTFYNYITGLSVSLIFMLLVDGGFVYAGGVAPRNYWIYLGGAVSVATVFISSMVIQKLPAFHVTLALFVGQMLAAVLLDWLMEGTFAIGSLVGGLLVALGLALITRKPSAQKPNDSKGT